MDFSIKELTDFGKLKRVIEELTSREQRVWRDCSALRLFAVFCSRFLVPRFLKTLVLPYG